MWIQFPAFDSLNKIGTDLLMMYSTERNGWILHWCLFDSAWTVILKRNDGFASVMDLFCLTHASACTQNSTQYSHGCHIFIAPARWRPALTSNIDTAIKHHYFSLVFQIEKLKFSKYFIVETFHTPTDLPKLPRARFVTPLLHEVHTVTYFHPEHYSTAAHVPNHVCLRVKLFFG